MRRSITAGVLMALAFLIPAVPAMAQTPSSGPSGSCQTDERKVYKDIRQLVNIDLDTASITDVRVLANRILFEANAESLTTLPGRLQERLDGTADDLRAFLKKDLQGVWSIDLRIAVDQTMAAGGPNVKAAAQKALDDGTIDVFLAYLNDGLYVARALDCASASPSASASTSASPSASVSAPASSVSASASVSSSAAAAGTLPTTGANTSLMALAGGALILFGIGAVLVARRVRT